MRRTFALAVFLFVGLATTLFGCGRDQVEDCQSNAQCMDDEVCLRGMCVAAPDGDGGTPDADAGPVDDTGEQDPDADGGGGGCYEFNGMCVREECNDGGCSTVGCEVECEDWEEADGCSCAAKNCDSPEACGVYTCLGGNCAPCGSDADCADGESCQPDGRCLAGESCMSDEDCGAREECNDGGECVERDECVLDDDCGDQEICFNGRCTYSPECESDNDCREGMECIGDQCYEKVCRGHEDCEGDQLCDGGECVAPPKVARCFVATNDQKIARNERVKLEALAVDSNGDGVSATFEWSSSAPQVAEVESNNKFAVGGAKSGTAKLTARTAGQPSISCDDAVELTNLGNVKGNQFRVVVTDARSGKPVNDAVVRLGNGKTTKTNRQGIGRLGRPGGTYQVSVFHPNYNYITVQGVRSPDIRIPLMEKEGDGPVAGFRGQFDKSQLNTSGDVTLGLAGAGITGGMLELGLNSLLGQPFVRTVQTPQGNAQIPLPAGMVAFGTVFGFNFDAKKKYHATTPGGPRLAWGLAGEVRGQKLLQLFTGGGGNTLANLLPLFNRFDHSVRPLQLQDRARVTDSGDFDGDGDTSEKLPDYQNFPKVDLKPSVRQNLVTQVSVSNFPIIDHMASEDEKRAETAVLVGGNMLQSPGFVPLGISATTDEDDDGYPDLRNLSMAPPHGPLAGGRFSVIALAFNGGNFSQQSGIAMPDNFSAALWSKQTLPTQVSLGTFPNATQGKVNIGQRRIELTNADAGPVYRAKLVGEKRSWEIWSMGPQGSMGTYQHTIDVPQATGGRADLFKNGEVVVDAVQVSVGIDALVKATGIGLRDIGLVATAFNRTKLK